MSSSQGGSNGNPPSVPVLTGIQNAIGLGSPLNGAPQVTPPNQANFNVPNATQVQQAVETLQNAQIAPDQTGLNQAIGQESALGQSDLSQMQNGAAPGQSAAEIGTAQAVQQSAGTANAATQNSTASAANPLAAQRQAGAQQAQTNQAAVSAGAQARAQEEQQLANNAQNAFSSAMQGSLSGASQRVQAQVATDNLVQQAVQDRTQLAMMQLQGSMNYAQLSQQYQLQQRQDYINAQIQAIHNQQVLIGALLSTAGQVGGSMTGALGKAGAASGSAGGTLNAATVGSNTGTMDSTAVNSGMTEAIG